jgi:hypothetical protein
MIGSEIVDISATSGRLDRRLIGPGFCEPGDIGGEPFGVDGPGIEVVADPL